MAKPRPVLILSGESFNHHNDHVIAAMITTTKTTKWLGDMTISNLETTGLSHPSMIRMKLFTLQSQVIMRTIGMLDLADQKTLIESFRKLQLFGH